MENVSDQVKDDVVVSSSLSLVKIAHAQPGKGKSSSSASASRSAGSGSSSSLGRSGSASRKRSSLLPRSSTKCFKGGKGGAPSSGSKQGFRKWEPYLCLTLSGGCLSLHWQAWRDRGAEPWVVEVLRERYQLPFLSVPQLSSVPISMPLFAPSFSKGLAVEGVLCDLIAKGAVELSICQS